MMSMGRQLLDFRAIALGFTLLLVQNLVAVDPVNAAEAKAGWQADWEKTVKAAEREGEVVVYCTDGLDLVFREGLQRKYPKTPSGPG